MTEPELRALVRDVLARQGLTGGSAVPAVRAGGMVAHPRHHSSHAMFVLPTGSESDGPCLIEPAVTCNHCGYCKSYGH